jgi:UDP-glucose 4-epimerase
MNVLITGGAGFIGTNLIKELLTRECTITSIDNYSSGFVSNHQDGVNYIDGDIREIKNYEDFGNFNVVYHLAAIARIQPSFKQPIDYFETNTNGTLNIVDYCTRFNIPLIYSGSGSHHGGKFKNPYTFSKDIGEEIIKLYQEHFNLKCSIARFYNVYGPYHIKDGEYCTIIGKWEKLYDENKKLTIYGDGSKRRDFTHVNDVVDGLIKIFTKSRFGFIFELGRGKNHSILEIAKMFGGEFEFSENKPGEVLETLCDNSFTKDMLGWEPKINIEDYIKEHTNK